MPLDTLDPVASETRKHIFEFLRSTIHKPTLATLARVFRGLSHFIHYIGQLAPARDGLPSSSFIRSPVARKLRQIRRTKRVFLEDGTAAVFLLEAMTCFKELCSQLRTDLKLDGLLNDDGTKHKVDVLSGSLFPVPRPPSSFVLGESLARCITLFPAYWDVVLTCLRRGSAWGSSQTFASISLPIVRIP
ncbi:hypothetical protein IAR50_001784 [Cryptococcus sp. DSM 104548]